ncbi:ribonuclease P protein component [Alkaliphilus sp. MSJ-5]|uniref:Ribonuclease P protein component n=1 Tax=Alkaliphilus flagellatus TaxID=2841507 RepID=A0ABS6G1D1_9FIRM|nr:ribonuclease P protein component [Alkaliphilus flagellatus]MBU5676295.1 ribonuclease P protein component [Alkaliphilus flagellatus]
MKAINRLKKNEDFRKVYQKRNSMANRLLIIYISKNEYEFNRVGFTVSKKVGKSVVRSRVKRLLNESYRLNDDKVLQGYDIIFVARDTSAESTYKEVESAMIHLLKKMKLIKR